MKSDLGSTSVASSPVQLVEKSTNSETLPPEKPYTIVLQPTGHLDGVHGRALQQSIEQSLEQAIASVIVDFLWVDSTDSDGISSLIAGLRQALALGKSLSFRSMDFKTHRAVQAEWTRQQESLLGSRSHLFNHELEQFLDTWASQVFGASAAKTRRAS